MTIFGPDAGLDTFTVDRGEIVFVPRGYLHHIENIGTEVASSFLHLATKNLKISVFLVPLVRCLVQSLI